MTCHLEAHEVTAYCCKLKQIILTNKRPFKRRHVKLPPLSGNIEMNGLSTVTFPEIPVWGDFWE